ncbi:MAG: hypothetical protein K2J04_06335 [Lachnospiraceae bacterium]|nr:hypothetical protein [Lachnospiraceae bacterium]
MKKLYEKNELTFAIAWQAPFCVSCRPLSFLLLSRRITYLNGTGFANPPYPPAAFFIMCRYSF